LLAVTEVKEMAEREEVPDVEWGQRGDPSGVQRRTVHGESRKKIADALSTLAEALIPELRRQNIESNSMIQLRMSARYSGTTLHISDFFFEQAVTSSLTADAKRIGS
jgi:hypothetical protein